MDKATEKVKYFLEKYNLLNYERPFLAAFSGGYDSMCLLDILAKFNSNVIAIHLNHNWRGIESDKEEENCKLFCKTKHIKFYSEKLPDGIQKTETAAREARYEFFNRCAKKFNSDVIFTAHNANDNAETIIYRITKGTGIKGLSGICEKRDIFYRPLLTTRRDEIEEYCRQNNLFPNNDSSNKDIKYKRNLIRLNILPELEKINPNVIDAINSLAQNAQNENLLIEDYLNKLDFNYETEKFITFSKPLQLRILYDLFLKNGLDYDKSRIERALEFIEQNRTSKSGKTLSAGENLWLFANNKHFRFINKTSKNDLEINITQCGEYVFENKIFSLEPVSKSPPQYPDDKDCIAYVNLGNFDGLTLRHRKDGDIIKPLGTDGTQKLKKYLNEKKVPSYEKERLIFLALGNEILWAPTLGISDKIKVVTTPSHVLKLTDREN